MSRNPRDPLLRGWYGYYGEGVVREEDMSVAFGYEDTKDLNFKDTLDYFKDELSLDTEDALERVKQQGKKKDLAKRKAPESIKKKKGFIDTLIIKELDDDKEGEKDIDIKEIHPLLLRNIKSIKRMAEKLNIPVSVLIKALKDE